MGRAGRYTLAVMAWVAAYAGWSSIIGLVVAAVTGDRPRAVSPGVSALLTVLGPLVPTLVALWFNDWARDGFPSREQQRAAKAVQPATAADPAGAASGAAAEPAATDVAPEPAPVEPADVAPAAPVPLVAPAPEPAAPEPPTVAAHPLGVPAASAEAAAPAGAFPVAPLLRDRD